MTPESDEALYEMLGAMRRQRMPGSYGLVGKKVEALKVRGRHDILDALKQERSIGYHSYSHSEHPTLAEDLVQMDYPQAVNRFVERECPGVQAVREGVRAPGYFTQPGANWVPEAAQALPKLGMDVFFTDSFNSYVIDLPGPYWYGEVVLVSFPVVNPRPFGLGLPDNLGEAIRMIEARQHLSQPFMVMLHPTELVTHKFWDAVNFPRGTTRTPLMTAPVRPGSERRAALASFERYLQEIRRLDIEWSDAQTLRDAVKPRRHMTVDRRPLMEGLARHGWGPLELPDGWISAAEALYAVAKLWTTNSQTVVVGQVGAPDQWEPAGFQASSPGLRLSDCAHDIVRSVQDTGKIPSQGIGGTTLEQSMYALAGDLPLSFLGYIKDPEQLHWHWPIFPEGFRPWRLYQDARRLAWTLKPAQWVD